MVKSDQSGLVFQKGILHLTTLTNAGTGIAIGVTYTKSKYVRHEYKAYLAHG